MTKITDPAKLAELQNKRAELASGLQQYHSDHEKTWSAEDDAAWDRMNASYDEVHSQLDAHQKACEAEQASQQAAASRAERLSAVSGHGSRFNAAARNLIQNGGGQLLGVEMKPQSGPLKGMNRAQIGALAMASWMAGGLGGEKARAACAHLGFNPNVREIDCELLPTGEFIPLRNQVVNSRGNLDDVFNVLSTTTGADGGYVISETFVRRLEVAMIANSGMMQTAEIIRTATGEAMRWPTVDDTGNSGSQIGESTEVSQSDPTFGQQTWNAYKFTSDMIKVPYELLEDNFVNLDALIPDLAGLRIGRIINNKATLGNGVGTMKGITEAAPQGVETASSTAITFDEVIDLEHSVNRVHRGVGAAGYMLNDTTLKLLRKLKDGEDRYLWQSGANTGAPDTLNTYRFTINDDMENPTAGNASILFGKLSNYKLRMVNSVRFRRLEERYAELDQVAFVAFVRADGDLLDAGDHPVKKMVQKP